LKHKTQVFLAPVGDHYRTRLTHTLEVTQIGRSMARALRLNEDLVEAMAMGHDVGHTPFGHIGEELLGRFLGPEGFRHNEQSVRIVEKIEKNGAGLNLTHEVRDGIAKHSAPTEGGVETAAWGIPETPEGWIVRYADKIAYLHHDIDDAMRAGIVREEDIPQAIRASFGRDRAERLDTIARVARVSQYRTRDVGGCERSAAAGPRRRRRRRCRRSFGGAAPRLRARCRDRARWAAGPGSRQG